MNHDSIDLGEAIEKKFQSEEKPQRPAKEKHMVTIRRYSTGPYVRQEPKHVRKSFRELVRAVQASEEYATAFFGELCAPMIATGIASEAAATATNLIMIRLFGRNMGTSKAFRQWEQYQGSGNKGVK
jgi:hypothetical protein